MRQDKNKRVRASVVSIVYEATNDKKAGSHHEGLDFALRFSVTSVSRRSPVEGVKRKGAKRRTLAFVIRL